MTVLVHDLSGSLGRAPRRRRLAVLGLRWRDVDLVEGVLRVAESKSEERERTIALSPALVDALAEQYQRTNFRGVRR